MNEFIDIPFSTNNLDRYINRTAIFEAVKANLDLLSGKLLDIGCGSMPYKKYVMGNSKVSEYIGLDIEGALTYDPNIKPDFTWDGINMPFENASFGCAFGTEVLEHCPDPEVVLKEVHRILNSGGVFFFTVPFLWNLHETPHDEYRYTPYSLERHLKNSGFTAIKIKATGGWHASMSQMIGLWVRRSPMSDAKKNILSSILKPIMKYLIKLDDPESVIFKEGQMITGLYGTARKLTNNG